MPGRGGDHGPSRIRISNTTALRKLKISVFELVAEKFPGLTPRCEHRKRHVHWELESCAGSLALVINLPIITIIQEIKLQLSDLHEGFIFAYEATKYTVDIFPHISVALSDAPVVEKT